MRVSLFITLFLLVVSAQAQNFRAGMLLGVVASQVDGDNSGGFNKGGIAAGLYTKLPFNDKWAAQAELKFMQKGSRDIKTLKRDGYDSYFGIDLNYIEMTFKAQYNINKKLKVEAGPSIGYLISASVDPDGWGKSKVSYFNKYDLSTNIGIGYQINDRWYGNIIYTYSVMSIVKINIAPTPYFDRRILGAYNNITMFTMYYQFGGEDG